MKIADARKQFAEIINKAAYGKERIILTRHGRPVAGIVPMDDINFLNNHKKQKNKPGNMIENYQNTEEMVKALEEELGNE